jgi:hypothetical protein
MGKQYIGDDLNKSAMDRGYFALEFTKFYRKSQEPFISIHEQRLLGEHILCSLELASCEMWCSPNRPLLPP